MGKGYITFYKEEKEYQSISTDDIKKQLSEIGINIEHNCLIRKQVHIIVNDGDKLDLKINQTDTHFQKTVKEKLIQGEQSIILKV